MSFSSLLAVMAYGEGRWAATGKASAVAAHLSAEQNHRTTENASDGTGCSVLSMIALKELCVIDVEPAESSFNRRIR